MHRSLWKVGFNWISVPRERAKPVSRFIWKRTGTGDCPAGVNLGLRREKSSTSMAGHEAQRRIDPEHRRLPRGEGTWKGFGLVLSTRESLPGWLFVRVPRVCVPWRFGRARRDFMFLAAWCVRFLTRCQQPPFQGQNIYPKCNSPSILVRMWMITYVNTVAETKRAYSSFLP